MFRYRHVQFSVFRRAFGGVGEAGLQQFNIMNGDNGLSGLGVPAKSITIMNHGPGIVYYSYPQMDMILVRWMELIPAREKHMPPTKAYILQLLIYSLIMQQLLSQLQLLLVSGQKKNL